MLITIEAGLWAHGDFLILFCLYMLEIVHDKKLKKNRNKNKDHVIKRHGQNNPGKFLVVTYSFSLAQLTMC